MTPVQIDVRGLARLYRSLKQYASEMNLVAQYLQLAEVQAALRGAGVWLPFGEDDLQLAAYTAQSHLAAADAALAELAGALPPGTLDDPDLTE